MILIFKKRKCYWNSLGVAYFRCFYEYRSFNGRSQGLLFRVSAREKKKARKNDGGKIIFLFSTEREVDLLKTNTVKYWLYKVMRLWNRIFPMRSVAEAILNNTKKLTILKITRGSHDVDLWAAYDPRALFCRALSISNWKFQLITPCQVIDFRSTLVSHSIEELSRVNSLFMCSHKTSYYSANYSILFHT